MIGIKDIDSNAGGVTDAELEAAIAGVSGGGGYVKKIDLYSAVAENPSAPLSIPSYDNTPQGTHPSVLYFKEKWHGYNYWMAYTPYPNSNDDFENPCILASNDKITWVVPAGLVNPIEPMPVDGTYYADTHLLFHDNRLYCYWRGFKNNPLRFHTWVKTSTDGVNWTPKVLALDEVEGGGSPIVIKDGNEFVMFDIDFLSPVHRIFKRKSLDPLNFQDAVKSQCTFEGLPTGHEIWHFNIEVAHGIYYCLMTTTAQGTNGTGGDLLFGVVENKNHFKFIGYPVLKKEAGWTQNRLYRGSIWPSEITEDGIVWDCWYGAVDGSNRWWIGYTEIRTYYYGHVPRFLPKQIKTNQTLHDYHSNKTLVVQGTPTLTIPDGLKKDFQLNFDVLQGSTAAFAAGTGVTFSGYAGPYAGNEFNEVYKLSPKVIRFLRYGASAAQVPQPSGTTITYDNIESAALDGTVPTGIYMSSDGTKLFVADNSVTSDRALTYLMTTPFSLATMAMVPQSLSIQAQSTTSLGVWVNEIGNVMVIAGGGAQKGLYRYGMSTPNDVTTGAFQAFKSFTFPADPRGIQFSSDGLKMYLAAINSNIIYEYNLSQPYDFETATLNASVTSNAPTSGFPAIYMSNDGKTMLALDTPNSLMKEFKLDTAFNVTTAVWSKDIPLGTGSFNAMFVREDEQKIFIVNFTTKRVRQYSLSIFQ